MVCTSPRSLAATMSMSWSPAATARQKLRPMRPKPFTPTRTVTVTSLAGGCLPTLPGQRAATGTGVGAPATG